MWEWWECLGGSYIFVLGGGGHVEIACFKGISVTFSYVDGRGQVLVTLSLMLVDARKHSSQIIS